jgi:hypothetical protein
MIMNMPFEGTVHSWSPAQLDYAREKYTIAIKYLEDAQEKLEFGEDDLLFAEDLYARMNKLTMQLELLTQDVKDRHIMVERLWNSPRS